MSFAKTGLGQMCGKLKKKRGVCVGEILHRADTSAKSHKVITHVKRVNKLTKLLALCFFIFKMWGTTAEYLQTFCLKLSDDEVAKGNPELQVHPSHPCSQPFYTHCERVLH